MRLSSILPAAEDGYLPPSSHCTISVAPLFLASLTSSSLTGLLSTAGFSTCSKKGGVKKKKEWYGMVWSAGTGVLNSPSYLVLPTDSIIPSPDKAGVFPYFSNMTPFLSSSLTPPPSDIIFPVSSSISPVSEGSLMFFLKLAASRFA